VISQTAGRLNFSFRSVAPPSIKHGQEPEAKKEMRSQLKYNLEDKSAKR
jgi:hypothetical protein